MKSFVPVLGLLAALGNLACAGTSAEDEARLDLLEQDRVLDVTLESGDLVEETSLTASTAFGESSVLRTYDVEPDQRLAFAEEALRAAASSGWTIGSPVDEDCGTGYFYVSATKDYGPWSATLLLDVDLADEGDEVDMKLTAPNAERNPGEATKDDFPPTESPAAPCAG